MAPNEGIIIMDQLNNNLNDQTEIKLTIANSGLEDVIFRVKTNTKFSKIFKAYKENRKCEEKQLRFLFDGSAIGDDQTLKDLGIYQDETIDCVMEQEGGSGN